MSDSPPRFSLRTFAGNTGLSAPAQKDAAEPDASVGQTRARSRESVPDLDPPGPMLEPPRRLPSESGSGSWEAGNRGDSLPSLPALRTAASGSPTEDRSVRWQPPDLASLAPPGRSAPTTELAVLSPSEAAVEREGPARLAGDMARSGPVLVSLAPAEPGPSRPRQRWQRWDVAVGTVVLLLVAYLLLAGVLYASRLWAARQSNSVVLLQEIGHGGVSQITVTFEHNHLTVTEIDNDDPTRVTILTVTEAIVLSTDKTVLEAWFQAVLQPSRLDLVIQLDGGLDWPPYHPQFTTILINNVAALKQDPHAPGLRAPTAAELQQALHTLGP